MRSMILILCLFTAAVSMATTKGAPACVSFIPCGTYQGSGSWYTLDGKPTKNGAYLEKTVITPVDDHTVALEEYVYDKTQKPEDGYVLKAKFVFQSNGQYNAVLASGETVASGVCQETVCTFGFFPWKNKDGSVTGNVNTLRFEKGQLRRLMLVSEDLSDDSRTNTQRSLLTKQ